MSENSTRIGTAQPVDPMRPAQFGGALNPLAPGVDTETRLLLCEYLSMITTDDVMNCPGLPSLPAVAVKVLELTRDARADIDAIATVVQSDPALSVKILKTVNSSYYGLPTPCPSISRALGYLGLATVKSLVLGFSLADFSSGGDEDRGWDEQGFWKRNLYAAAAARRLAKINGGCEPEEAFAAGLMLDLGMLALLATDKVTYGAIIAGAFDDHRAVPEVERETLGFDHAEVGALLAERWHLPPQLIAAIRHHHDGDCPEHDTLVRTVALGAELAVAMTLPDPGTALNAARYRAEEWFGFPVTRVNELVKTVTHDVGELGTQLEIDAGDPIDPNWLLQQASEATVEHQLALVREADSLRRSNDELAKMAMTDGLTNVANRKRFDDELANRFQQASAFKGTLGLIIADADHFKKLNDTLGHQAGDAVLVELAKRLEGAVRGIDLVCRYGGEEFGVILPGASVKDVAAIAERLRQAVCSTPFDLSDVPGAPEEADVTISLGAAVFDPDTEKLIHAQGLLVKAADQALYVAKEAGRNCVRVFRIEGRAEEAA